jgi:tetratricopeptide (TPR) repeat protein
MSGITLPIRAQNAEALYADRANMASAQRALDIWSGELKAKPGEFEVAWKLARIAYWLGTHGAEDQRRNMLERGVDAARTASTLQPGKPEGFFWLAANMGALAESFGMRAGLKYRKPIKDALETVLRLDPAFQNGSADRALGRWYARVPGLFGGSSKQAEAHLRTSLEYDPDSTISHFFLAELLLDEGRKSEARAELQKVIDAPIKGEWGPEDDDYRARARTLLPTIK